MFYKLYPYRFEIFFFSLMSILFGSLIIPTGIFENILSPILFQVNLIAGILLISKKKRLMWFLVVLLVISALVFGSNFFQDKNDDLFNFVRMATYFLFYLVVTSQIILQVWRAETVNKNVIFGLVCGYIALGLIGFFVCLSIEMANPNSFQGIISANGDSTSLTEGLMYYSYVTLLTIGYGDITPVTALAKKSAILIGLMGQMYLVVLTAIVVGKYLKQIDKKHF